MYPGAQQAQYHEPAPHQYVQQQQQQQHYVAQQQMPAQQMEPLSAAPNDGDIFADMAQAFILDTSQHQQQQQQPQPKQAYAYSHATQQQRQQQPQQKHYGNSTHPTSNGAHHSYVKSEMHPQHAAAAQVPPYDSCKPSTNSSLLYRSPLADMPVLLC